MSSQFSILKSISKIFLMHRNSLIGKAKRKTEHIMKFSELKLNKPEEKTGVY